MNSSEVLFLHILDKLSFHQVSLFFSSYSRRIYSEKDVYSASISLPPTRDLLIYEILKEAKKKITNANYFCMRQKI